MANTTNLGLPLMAAAQSQKHITHNDAILSLDAVVQLSVKDTTLTAPPGSPAEGDRYLIASSPTGAWAGKDLNITYYTSGAWVFLVPRLGWMCWDEPNGVMLVWTGSSWEDLLTAAGAVSTTTINNNSLAGKLTMLGIGGATPDATNKLSVNSAGVLLNNAGSSVTATLNKNAAANDASLTFQDAFSTRALFGLLGDDDFHMKVSPDGSTYKTAMVIDKSTGLLSFPQKPMFAGYLNYNHYADTTFVNTDINVEDYDTTGSFASNVFTAPIAGFYALGYTFSWTENGTNQPTEMFGRLLLNGTTPLLPGASRIQGAAYAADKITMTVIGVVHLDVGDTVRLQHAFYNLDGYATANLTRFWGELVKAD